MPEINLVPMMDVLMTILTFFIIVSMSAQFGSQALDITLPNADSGANAVNYPDPLIVGMNEQEQLSLNGQPVSQEQLSQQMQAYLSQNPEGSIILQADYRLPYQQIVNVLGQMRAIGGDRVSLGID
ncbi:biopolymer transporter ExbD [Oculatella sp. FACHB-28]|nr:biopolymer transporter ExbD [Cyanobacteria bacterium FACHB-471]MBD1997823.1 biopolymer transporter ExbD [Leptolyngbya sp. FACHB-541]MBD2059755.1 biopolymer transporter ExbD [Oculatella sp. FACHB-28]MBD2067674.1 biopolymer transporter ExbD [Leptolyngbya sp. FACHB-671]